jgi:hypothetical protein
MTALAGCGHDGPKPSANQDMSVAGMAGNDMAVGGGSDMPGGADMTNTFDMTNNPDSAGAATHDLATVPQYKFTTVITILLENHDYNEIVGNTTNAPYINSLIQQYGLATNYRDIGHPSLPNYVYMTSGKHNDPGDPLTSDDDVSTYLVHNTFGNGKMLDDDNLGNQLQVAKVPWRGYFETMFGPCQLTDSGDRRYAARHNPFIYFNNILFAPNLLCQSVDVDYGANFANDLASGNYKFMWISPDAWDDGHGVIGNENPLDMLKVSDDWCAKNVQAIIDSDIFKQGGVIFLTWDEAEGHLTNDMKDDGDRIPMIVISPKLKSKGFTTDKAYTHANYLATMEDLFGLPRLGGAVGVDNMMEFFQ